MEDGKDPGGGLDAKGEEGWPMGGPVGLTGAALGGNVGCWGCGGGRARAAGGGPGREKGGDPDGTPGGGADEGKWGAWPKGEGLGAEFGGGRLRFKLLKLAANELGFKLGL